MKTKIKNLCFTLIELLVVIAIIAILMAILLPSLSSAKRTAKRISCMNNIRQISSSMFAYANDYNGNIPGARCSYPREYEACANSTPGGSRYNGPIGAGILHNETSLRGPSSYFCPGRNNDYITENMALTAWKNPTLSGWVSVPYFLATSNIGSDTSTSSWQTDSSFVFEKWHKLGKVPNDKPMVFEFCFKANWTVADTPLGASKHNHNLGNNSFGYNFGFFDGSSGWVKDPGNSLETTFNYHEGCIMPWRRAPNAGAADIHLLTKVIGWTDAKYNSSCPYP